MMKISIIVPTLSLGGGAEKTATMLANSLAEKEYNVDVYVLSSDDPKYNLSSKVNYIKVDENIATTHTINKNILRYKYIKKQLLKLKPSIIIGYTIIGGIYASVLSKSTNIHCIVCERQDPYQFASWMRRLRDHVYKYASGAVFQTREAQEYFQNIIKDSVIIPNFLDTDSLPDIISWENRKNIIVNAGRLVPAKNQKNLIEAFSVIHKNYPDYKLIIYGEGPLRSELQEQINSLDLDDCVSLPGRKDDVLNFIKYAKLFVLSSDYEGYPNALLEAMSLGIPCISTDCPCGGPKSMINDGVNGSLIPMKDSNALVSEMEALLSSEMKLKSYAEESVYVRSNNSKDRIIKKWIDYIEVQMALK